ncbi:hypothetical protein, partial [Proteus mirabilis]|uniref:hypothetical protein n=1 Tax=Proteus mirabilis TaxID=584 RepID=UPI002FF3BDC7
IVFHKKCTFLLSILPYYVYHLPLVLYIRRCWFWASVEHTAPAAHTVFSGGGSICIILRDRVLP